MPSITRSNFLAPSLSVVSEQGESRGRRWKKTFLVFVRAQSLREQTGLEKKMEHPKESKVIVVIETSHSLATTAIAVFFLFGLFCVSDVCC